MKLHIKNQLSGKIEFTCGDKEYALEPEQEIAIEVKDEDCMYFDQFHTKINCHECRFYNALPSICEFEYDATAILYTEVQRYCKNFQKGTYVPDFLDA